MKISLSKLKLVQGKDGPVSWLRFDLSFMMPTGVPAITVDGCLYRPDRGVMMPLVKMGKWHRSRTNVHVHDDVKTFIRELLHKDPDARGLIEQLPAPIDMTPEEKQRSQPLEKAVEADL